MNAPTCGLSAAGAAAPAAVPRLLARATGPDLDRHLRTNGPPPLRGRTRPGQAGLLVDTVERAGLRGRGGGWFPTARKMRAVAERTTRWRPAVVVGNGMEGEPLSGKDARLLTVAPHLVFDGASLAAEAVGATRVVIAVHAGSFALRLADLARERAARGVDPVEIEIVSLPRRYVASEETALVRWLNGGPALPTAVPPRPFERGVRRRPTLINNVETLAHLALIAREGAAWFRGVGTPQAPGTTLVTVGGAVALPDVFEVALGTPVGAVLAAAGGPTAPPAALLVGGYGGTWLAVPGAGDLPLAPEPLARAGGTLGAGIVYVLPGDVCGLAETARIAAWMAEQGAQQCGPCRYGLPALAADLDVLARPRGRAVSAHRDTPGRALRRLRERLGITPGRGACHHPDGVVRLIESALTVFADEVEAHGEGRCRAVGAAPGPASAPTPGEPR